MPCCRASIACAPRQGPGKRSGALLPGDGQREFAIADANREALGELSSSLLAIGRDKLGKSGEQAGLSEAIPVDAVDAGLGPGFMQIAERSPFLFMVRSLPRSL